MTKTVELYNILGHRGRLCTNGWLVRVVANGRTTFVKFGRDEEAARTYAASAEVPS